MREFLFGSALFTCLLALGGRVVGQPTERNLRAEGDCEGSLHLFLDGQVIRHPALPG